MIHSYPWYIKDWQLSRSRAAMTLEQRGLYREILDLLYNSEGLLNENPEVLRKMCGVEKQEWNRAWPIVKESFDALDGGLSHPRVRQVVGKLEFYHSSRVSAGKAGAKRRWKQTDSTAIAQPIASTKQADSLPQPLPQPQPQYQHTTPREAAKAEPWGEDPTEAIWEAVEECQKIWPKSSNRDYARGAAERESVKHPAGPVEWAKLLPARAKIWAQHYRAEKAASAKAFVPLLDFWIRDAEYAREPPRKLGRAGNGQARLPRGFVRRLPDGWIS